MLFTSCLTFSGFVREVSPRTADRCTLVYLMFEDELEGGACRRYGRQRRYVQGFGGETRVENSTWKT
jgi:hypothetical protein